MPFYSTEVITLESSGSHTSSGNSSSYEVGEFIEGRAFLDITAVSGTNPTLDVTIQDSPDDSVWYDHTSFAQQTVATNVAQSLTTFGSYIRAHWAIAGTNADFTFSIELDGRG